MLWLKSCPKCGGDLYGNRDHFGWFVACLQCGNYLVQAEEVSPELSGHDGGATRPSNAESRDTDLIEAVS